MGFWWRSRAPFAALEESDPCAARAIEHEVNEHGNPTQRARLRERLAECAARSATPLCTSVAKDVDEHRMDEEHAKQLYGLSELGQATAGIYRALASNRPQVAHLKLTPSDLECDTLWPKLVAGLAESEVIWATAVDVSVPMKEALRARGLSALARRALVRHAEMSSTLRAGGEPSLAAIAETVCGLVDYFEAGDAGACRLPPQAGTTAADGGSKSIEDPFADLPPLFAEAARSRQAQRAAYFDCVIECGKNRTPEQRQADDQRAQLAIGRQRECSKECGKDSTCLSNCLRTIPPTSMLACENSCGEKHPGGLRPPPRP